MLGSQFKNEANDGNQLDIKNSDKINKSLVFFKII